MANGIDARMHLMQPARRKAPLNHSLSQAQIHQLPPSHHPVLPVSQLSDRLLTPTPLANLSQSPYTEVIDRFGGHVRTRAWGASILPPRPWVLGAYV